MNYGFEPKKYIHDSFGFFWTHSQPLLHDALSTRIAERTHSQKASKDWNAQSQPSVSPNFKFWTSYSWIWNLIDWLDISRGFPIFAHGWLLRGFGYQPKVSITERLMGAKQVFIANPFKLTISKTEEVSFIIPGKANKSLVPSLHIKIVP